MKAALRRAQEFCQRFDLRAPILLAPMAGASPPTLSTAVSQAGGLGACGALLMKPKEIIAWAEEFRRGSDGPFQINLWIPDPPPQRNAAQEARVREFLARWGPAPPEDAGDATLPDFDEQCEALLAASPPIVSSIMGLYPPQFVSRLRERGIAWFATISTVAEARAAEKAGADVIVAQGMEAGGHRGCFNADRAECEQVGLFALVPAVCDAVTLPVVAAGGIADGRGVAAALVLGADAVQIGTAFLVCPEAKIHPAWAKALEAAAPEDTVLSKVFSGRPARSLATEYVRAATSAVAPPPAPYPVQRGLTSAMRAEAQKTGDVQRMQAWAGQSARLAHAIPAAEVVRQLWDEARRIVS